MHAFATGVLAIAAAPELLVVAEQAPQLDNYHWILLLYRLAYGELATGFGYVDDPIPGMLEREQLVEYLRSLVEIDLEPRAPVGQAVQKHGGVEIADVLANRHLDRS